MTDLQRWYRHPVCVLCGPSSAVGWPSSERDVRFQNPQRVRSAQEVIVLIDLTSETHSWSEDNDRGIATGWLPGRLSRQGRDLAREIGCGGKGRQWCLSRT